MHDRRGGESLISNAIIYRTDKLGLVWQESRSRVLLAVFAFWDGLGQQQLLYVANLHLEGSLYRPNDRISQTRSALQRLEAHQRQHGIDLADAAVVVCGDINSGRHETVCHFLHRGRLEGGTTEPHLPKVEVTKTSIGIAHPYVLHEAYSSGGHDLPFTRKVPSLASTLDFIWASCQLEVAALYWPVECRHEGLIEHQALPNQHYPSDHLPIGAVLRMKHFYVPPFGDAHPPPPPAAGAQPDAVQEYSSGPQSDASELGLKDPGPGVAKAYGGLQGKADGPGHLNKVTYPDDARESKVRGPWALSYSNVDTRMSTRVREFPLSACEARVIPQGRTVGLDGLCRG
ncbi:hypothetical protein PLESTB_001724600 [Pleodorina starrii]|uniref:Endonuclease/exonuclease/phosphatase domain-containing protein n=1 Tax=Pleodorina starrii TaxID=330485 RepID=A0A9W6C0D1_9CHLO|nr:hypothetical protein PLESTB_001724600 [Pleodorina starrii]